MPGDAFAVRRIRALRAMLGYLPGVRWLTEAFLRSREYAADDSAVAATGEHSSLLRAFLKLQPIASGDRYAVGYMDFAVGRVNRLKGIADPDEAESAIGGARALLISFGVLVLPPLVTLFLTEPHLAFLLPVH
jgi:Zn-dependent protease with chaperone function